MDQEKDQQPSDTMLNNLPLELLDAVLVKSYFHWILNSSPDQSDKDAIRSLTSVDFCWFQRITKRLKTIIWKRLKALYDKTKRRTIIIRNNRNYFSENIELNDEMMLHLNCITDEQIPIIQRQRSTRSIFDKLLHVMKSFDERKFSNFVRYLRQTKQKTVARIMQHGGGVIKVQVQSRVANCMDKLNQKMKDFGNRTAPWSYQIDKLISQLREEDIEILNSQMERQTVVVWIWCRSQDAVENLRKLHESNKLADMLFGFADIGPTSSAPKTIQPMLINIDNNHFNKTVVGNSISVNFIERIDDGEASGIAKLRNEIYVVWRLTLVKLVIHVYEDRNPFRLKKKIELQEIGSTFNDIGSSEKDNCLYVSDQYKKCIWKITKETDDEYTIIKWLTTDFKPDRLSVSRNGNLLLTDHRNLVIYGSDAELIRSIQFPSDFGKAVHAVETSIGNFVILHYMEIEEIGWPLGKDAIGAVVSELTSNEQSLMAVRRFISPDKEKMLFDPTYLLLDSDDQVLLAEGSNDKVTLFDSDLKWNQIICSSDAQEEGAIIWTQRVCYDEENKQLIVGYLNGGITVYSFSRK